MVRTILFVHLLDLVEVLSLVDDIVVQLVPEGCCSDLGTGELGDGREVKAVDHQANSIGCAESCDGDTCVENGILRQEIKVLLQLYRRHGECE